MPKRKSFPLRIDPKLYEPLRRWADDELRSVNGQIEYLIKRALVQAGRWPPSQGPTAAPQTAGEPASEEESSAEPGGGEGRE